MSLILAVGLAMIASSHQENLLTLEDNKQMVQIHNSLRAIVNPQASNMKTMKYHEDLMESAKSLSEKCIFEHEDVDVDERTFKKFGQNIYVATLKIKTINNTAMSWFSERDFYGYSGNSCSRVCGHYTQMVWADTEFMGCSATYCDDITKYGHSGVLTVCNYHPQGNIGVRKPYEAIKSCKECKNELCRKICENGSVPKAVSSLWILVLSVPLALCKLL